MSDIAVGRSQDSYGNSSTAYRFEDAYVVAHAIGPTGKRATFTFKVGAGDLEISEERETTDLYSLYSSTGRTVYTPPRMSVSLSGELSPDRDGDMYMIELDKP